jgi:hypothetical protein
LIRALDYSTPAKAKPLTLALWSVAMLAISASAQIATWNPVPGVSVDTAMAGALLTATPSAALAWSWRRPLGVWGVVLLSVTILAVLGALVPMVIVFYFFAMP